MAKKTSTKKAKTLFDHLKHITAIQDPDYWETLSEEDRRSWSNFMVLRFLSMDKDWTELISMISPVVQSLEPELLYKVLISTIPKSRKFLKYVSAKGESYEPWLIELVSTFFEVPNSQASEYIDILYSIAGGHQTLLDICTSFGTEKSKIKKLKLVI